MQISVTGQSMDIGNALSQHVEDGINQVVTKYFKNAIFGNAVFSKQGNQFIAKIYVNEGTKSGVKIKGEYQANDVYAAFEKALAIIDKQLRRYHRYITDHKQKEKVELKLHNVTNSVIQSTEEDQEDTDNPVIIAEEAGYIETMSVGEAVLRMDMESASVFMFVNSGSGRINIVYKREDGNISWVDPKALESQRIAS